MPAVALYRSTSRSGSGIFAQEQMVKDSEEEEEEEEEEEAVAEWEEASGSECSRPREIASRIQISIKVHGEIMTSAQEQCILLCISSAQTRLITVLPSPMSKARMTRSSRSASATASFWC